MNILLALLLPIVVGGGLQPVNVVHRSTSTVYLYNVPANTTYMDMATNCRVLTVGTWAGDIDAPQVIRGQHVTIHDVKPTTVGLPWNVVTHNFTYSRVSVVVDGYGSTSPGIVGMCRNGDDCYTMQADAVPTCPMLHLPLVIK